MSALGPLELTFGENRLLSPPPMFRWRLQGASPASSEAAVNGMR
jgi:hypothetical protein